MEISCPLYYERVKDHPIRKQDPPGGHRHFAMATIGKVKILGWNNKKTRPQLARIAEDGAALAGHHAEMHVLYKIPSKKRKKAKIYVMRVTKTGKITMSKPCSHCTKTLLTEGVLRKNIWYTNSLGEWECLANS